MRLKQSSRSSRTAWNLIVERCFLLTATPLRSGLGTGFVEHQSIAFPTPLPRGFGLNSPTPRAILRSNLTVRMSTLPPSARSILKTCSPPTSCRHAMAPSAHFHATHTRNRDSGGKTRSERCRLHKGLLDSGSGRKSPTAPGKTATTWPVCTSRKKPWSCRARPSGNCQARPQRLQPPASSSQGLAKRLSKSPAPSLSNPALQARQEHCA